MAFVPSLPLAKASVRPVVSPRRPVHSAQTRATRSASARAPPSMSAPKTSKRDGNEIRGTVFVVGDNIDTDQIIPAEYLTLVPSNPDEYKKLGSYALIGLPEELYPTRYVQQGQSTTQYKIIIAGHNFGCGSSREHAPVALGAAGGCAVVAQSYARIFFRNCSATGELYPWESQTRLVEHFRTGDQAVIDFERRVITHVESGTEYALNDLGDVRPVIDAGGIFEYARQTGMISKK
ncbi:3-isopropylmalate dehydratase small subunit [Gracilaria domingensis]|nr:3-isopropylmalate dehydratase small subunit [Gracilaria domingensis]